MQKNMLDRREMRMLEDMLELHKDEIEKGKWNKTSYAAFATKKLGRPVTDSNVNSACKVMEIKFQGEYKAAALRSTHQLLAAVRLLAREIERMAGEIGVTVCPEVKAIAEQQSNTEEK